ncbi:MAG: hypothetical protein IE889_06330 [Campylobacterales bacterium]|nr:hypothetical protein [Campylobacterales bacterium]
MAGIVERCAANEIQIAIIIEYTLRGYYSQVKGRNNDIIEILNLPYDFKYSCPLCGARDCAQFIGYYYREVIDEKGTYYKAMPIARYLCRRKGKALGVKHRTFSLLPYQLLPYSKYSIPFIINALRKVYGGENNSVKELLDYLAGFGEQKYIDLSNSVFYAFRELILTAIDKMLAMGFYKDLTMQMQTPSLRQRLRIFLSFAEDFSCYKTDPEIRGPCALGYDYYVRNGGYRKNAHFLFGTPSQFR